MRPATPGVGRRPRQHAGFVTCHSVPPPQIIQKPAESKMGMLKAEVDILTKCDHPNIVRLYKVVDTEKAPPLLRPRCRG